jgi:hypothetical protein
MSKTLLFGTPAAQEAQRRVGESTGKKLHRVAEDALVAYEQLVTLDLLPEVERLIARRRRLADTATEAAEAVGKAA